MAHKTNILHKMVNVNFTLDEVNMTFSVEPLHHFHDNGRGYFYIWSPRQTLGQGYYGDGIMHSLHKVQNNGNPGNLKKPKYCIKVSGKGVHTIPINQSDIGSPWSIGPGSPGPGGIVPQWSPNEHFPHKVVRGDHGWDAVSHNTWNWMYRYEWAEQGIEFVDTIVTERGVGGIGSKYHRTTGWGQPTGKCGCYTYPVVQNNIEVIGETLFITDTTLYSVTCGGETKSLKSGVQDPENGVGDEYQEGIVITRPEKQKSGIMHYKNKWRMHYPAIFPEHVPETNFSDAMANHPNFGYMMFWDGITSGPSGGVGSFPIQGNTVSGSAGQSHNEPYHNPNPERNNISQIARSNNEAWSRIDKIENETGVEFIEYRHSLIQKVTDTTSNQVNPVTFEWEHLLVERMIPTSSTSEGAFPEPVLNTPLGNGSTTAWQLDLTDLASSAVNIGTPVPPNHPFATNHPAYGEFTSRIYAIVRKSSTLDVCGSPQVGVGNPDKGNPNWRNGLFDSHNYDSNGNILTAGQVNPKNVFYGAHVHGAGILPGTTTGTNFGAAGPSSQQKNGGRGSISRFMSSCKKPWTGDPLRNGSLIGNQSANPENWPDITHLGSRPDYTAYPAKYYIGRDSWKWDGYDNSGFTTTHTNPFVDTGARPIAWPLKSRYSRNWIGHMQNASSPFFKQNFGNPVYWNNTHLDAGYWSLDGTGYDANDGSGGNWHYGKGGNPAYGQPNKFCLPSIKELDSPSFFNHIVTFEEDEDSQDDYGIGNPRHGMGYECIDCMGHGPGCMPVQASNQNCTNGSTVYPNAGPYATYSQCMHQCNPYSTL